MGVGGRPPEAVLATVSVPSTKFELGKLFLDCSDIEIELESFVPVSSDIIPLFWVSGINPEGIERALRSNPATQEVSVLTRTDEKWLFQIHWNADVNGFVHALHAGEGVVLRGTGTPESWQFRLRFPDRSHLRSFFTECIENQLAIELLNIHSPGRPPGGDSLTDAQLEALSTTYERGYWDVPRGITLAELGSELGISDTAASERIRRGVKTLIEEHVSFENRE